MPRPHRPTRFMTQLQDNNPSDPKTSQLDKIDDAWKMWKENDTPETRRNMLAAVSPQVSTALRTFAPGMEKNLLLKANELALKAAQTYDPSRGLRFKSYVYQQLQPLQRLAGKRTNVIAIPERHLIEGKRLAEETQRFIDRKGYEPSTADLADFTGMSVKRIQAIRSHRTGVSESKATSPEGDPMGSQEEDVQRVWCEQVYNSLGSMDQKIYEWRTGYGGAPKLGVVDIAKRLGVSPATVSNRLQKIIGMVQEGINLA